MYSAWLPRHANGSTKPNGSGIEQQGDLAIGAVAVAQQPTPAKQHYPRLGLLRSHSPSLTEVLWRVLSWYPDACMVNNSA